MKRVISKKLKDKEEEKDLMDKEEEMISNYIGWARGAGDYMGIYGHELEDFIEDAKSQYDGYENPTKKPSDKVRMTVHNTEQMMDEEIYDNKKSKK